MAEELKKLIHEYETGRISRREFMRRAVVTTGSLAAANSVIGSLLPADSYAAQVAANDRDVLTHNVSYEGKAGPVAGYLARPMNAGQFPGLLVIHENRGLNPYIEDVARRLGTQNFIAFAPDGLTSAGGYPGDDEKGGQVFAKIDKPKMTEDFIVAARWLKSRPDCSGKIGVVGFCFGGGIANTLAVRLGADLAAAVPFYGAQPSAADVAKIKAPLLIHYASLDARIDAGWPAFEEALKANHVTYTAHMYEGANHGFHNDTTPRYDEAAAKLAWQRTLDFFNKYLKG